MKKYFLSILLLVSARLIPQETKPFAGFPSFAACEQSRRQLNSWLRPDVVRRNCNSECTLGGMMDPNLHLPRC
jgi:hypothetical protein